MVSPIKQSLYDMLVKDAQARGQRVDSTARDIIINSLIDKELLAQEAQKTGVDKQADFLSREAYLKQELLVNSFLQDYIKNHPISDVDTKAAYERYKKAYGDKELNVRHILVRTESEAKEIIEQLNKGADFSKLAKEKSIDTGSKERGGDLGWFSPATKIKAFSDVAANLAKGAISNSPVQTQFGWHIIKLVDTRPAQPITYEKIKLELQSSLQQENINKVIVELRKRAKITVNNQ